MKHRPSLPWLGAALLLTALPVLPAASQPLALFNGRDLTGWSFDLQDPNVRPEDVWSVKDGVLICKGRPSGVIRSQRSFSNFDLTVEWRWSPGATSGNSGVLIFCSTPRHLGIWPKSLEVQLASGNAGDFWVIGETVTVPDQEKRQRDRRILNLTDNSEKPMGEWNTMLIQARGGKVTVFVNGQKVNETLSCSATAGKICLQSEGTEIHFRKVELVHH